MSLTLLREPETVQTGSGEARTGILLSAAEMYRNQYK